MKNKFYILFLFIGVAIGIACTALYTKILKSGADSSEKSDTSIAGSSFKEMRLTDYKYIRPLVQVEPEDESQYYSGIKDSIVNYINEQKSAGHITNVSVYLRDFNKSQWMAINPDEKYDPGSLLKVGVLLGYLRMAEQDPSLLAKKWTYGGLSAGSSMPLEHYTDDTIIKGHAYTVRELITSMIVNSDNRATLFLEGHMNPAVLSQVFTDLGMAKPDFSNPHYLLSVKEYSVLFKAIYNVGYLSIPSSEYAASLLVKGKFRQGLLKELPAGIEVAHKFGEAGDQNMYELHEAGIVYTPRGAYLITVMTRGTDWDNMSAVIGHISRMAYDKMSVSPAL